MLQRAGLPSLHGVGQGVRWVLLLVLSVLLVLVLEALHLSAALLLGPMLAAVLLATADGAVRVPSPAFTASQGVIGCMIARSLTTPTLAAMLGAWPELLVSVPAVVAASMALGWLLARRRVLPGSTAIWGSFPGAASVMVLMADAHGADARLVAFMQYLRVVMVAAVASGVAHIAANPTAAAADQPWLAATFPAVAWGPLLATLALALGSSLLAQRSRLPAGPLLVPMVLGILLQDLGPLRIELPPWLLAACYAVVGWSVGLRFTRPILLHAARALPRVFGAILALLLACGCLAAGLVLAAGVDPLTAYLATSPGGVDSIAVIAASNPVDLPFVMAVQTARFLAVLLAGPHLARLVAEQTGKAAPPGS
ncbi:AbrB family transcriptional regulator [Paracraurococcus lichenis]|uniref:AbrB family transcriptional regulator n=1 Tax=Paracraurococcus lichenis TaxID=3064888 RepID=A0ABT9E9W0_9PROT|nr:AbrB family transcriptional regulator [Paracraurococcus sp. LOR1-02]MDO9712710.1 AbrB family transcriptional regulator [Paracraurococcus sp. LOR1-02]